MGMAWRVVGGFADGRRLSSITPKTISYHIISVELFIRAIMESWLCDSMRSELCLLGWLAIRCVVCNKRNLLASHGPEFLTRSKMARKSAGMGKSQQPTGSNKMHPCTPGHEQGLAFGRKMNVVAVPHADGSQLLIRTYIGIFGR